MSTPKERLAALGEFETQVVGLDAIDRVQLPVIKEDRYVKPPVVEAAREVARAETASEGLADLTQLGISKTREILELGLVPGDDDFGAILRAQVALIPTIFNTQTKVDEGQLRAKDTDIMDRLVKILEREAQKLPPMIEA